MKLLARLVLVFAFVFAQAGGIAHELWHSTTELGVDSKAPKKSVLCDFHTALASVLGAIHGGTATVDAVVTPDTTFIAADVTAARFSLLASRSRGPPALL